MIFRSLRRSQWCDSCGNIFHLARDAKRLNMTNGKCLCICHADVSPEPSPCETCVTSHLALAEYWRADPSSQPRFHADWCTQDEFGHYEDIPELSYIEAANCVLVRRMATQPIARAPYKFLPETTVRVWLALPSQGLHPQGLHPTRFTITYPPCIGNSIFFDVQNEMDLSGYSFKYIRRV